MSRPDADDQHVPPEYIPDEYIQVTNYTEDDLPALAEKVRADTGRPVDKVLDQLDTLVNEYNVPITEADRSVRAAADGEGKL